MNAKEKLIREILALDEAEAVRARIVISDEFVDETDMASLPAGAGRPAYGRADAKRRGRRSALP